MKFLEVLLIATQLAFVTCLPQDIRFTQPGHLSLGQAPRDSVSLTIAHQDYQPFGVQRLIPNTFFISDRNREQAVQSSPKLVSVAIPEGAPFGFNPNAQFVLPTELTHGYEHNQRFITLAVPTAQQADIVFGGTFPQRPDRLASIDHENEIIDRQQEYVSIPSRDPARLETVELNEKREHHFPQQQVYLLRNSNVPPDPSQEVVSASTYGMQIHRQAAGSLGAGDMPPIVNSAPIPKTSPPKRPESVFVTRLTAPSNDSRSPNTLMITKKPCEICCVGNEVEPCKSCCAHTPLLNPKTLKTVVG